MKGLTVMCGACCELCMADATHECADITCMPVKDVLVGCCSSELVVHSMKPRLGDELPGHYSQLYFASRACSNCSSNMYWHSQCLPCHACVCSELRNQLEDVSQQRSADQQQAQRQIEVGSRQLAAAQQQLQLKADIIHQLTGGLQVP